MYYLDSLSLTNPYLLITMVMVDKMMTKIQLSVLHILLVLYILFNIVTIVSTNYQVLFRVNYWQSYPELKRVFYNSQYKNQKFTGFIPDETAYSYAGGALIQGENPILIIPEAPPLGKYLIGLSAILFNNPNIFIVVFTGFWGLIMLYLLGLQILKSSLLALIPVAAITTEPLYRHQYTYVPLFDLAQFFFILSAFYFFNKGFVQKKYPFLFFAVANIFVGFFISTKFYTSGITIIVPFILVLLYNLEWKKLRTLLFSLWIPIAILLLSYLRVFAFGYNLREFLGIQKWIFIYWQGALVMPFTVWDLLFFNRWHTWWGEKQILSDAQWHIGWPIITTITFITIALYLLRKIKKHKEIEVLFAFVLCYSAFLSVGTPVVRYFIILLPILYIIATFSLQQCFYLLIQHVRKKK